MCLPLTSKLPEGKPAAYLDQAGSPVCGERTLWISVQLNPAIQFFCFTSDMTAVDSCVYCCFLLTLRKLMRELVFLSSPVRLPGDYREHGHFVFISEPYCIGPCISYTSVAMISVPDRNNLRKESVILAHDFRGLQSLMQG